jgi:hypothetical protein
MFYGLSFRILIIPDLISMEGFIRPSSIPHGNPFLSGEKVVLESALL